MANPPTALYAADLFTNAEKARIRDNEPSFSDRPNGVDLPDKLQTLLDAIEADRALQISGTATVLNGATTAVVTVGAAFNGAPVQVSFGEAPTAATDVSGVVAAGDLTITIDIDNTADLDVHWAIDGRT